MLQGGPPASPDLAAELQQFVREQLAEYKRPRWVEFIPELPKTPTGKIQRFKLRDGWIRYNPAVILRGRDSISSAVDDSAEMTRRRSMVRPA